MPTHRVVIQDSLTALFQNPVPEDDPVGRTILTRVLDPSPIDFAAPFFNFRDTIHLSALLTPGYTPVIWESKQKPIQALF